jgi:hypothetical protein
MARCDLGQGHQTVSQHRIEIGDGVRQRSAEQQVEHHPLRGRNGDFGPRGGLSGSDECPPHVQAGAPRDVGSFWYHDFDRILGAGQSDAPQCCS